MAKTQAADWRPHFAAYPPADGQLAGLLTAAVADFSNTQLLQVAADRLEELGDARSAEVIRAYARCAETGQYTDAYQGAVFRAEFLRVFTLATHTGSASRYTLADLELGHMACGSFAVRWRYVPENSLGREVSLVRWQWRQTLQVAVSDSRDRRSFDAPAFTPVVPAELPQPVVVGFFLWRAWWCCWSCGGRVVLSAEQAAEAQYEKLLEKAFLEADSVVNEEQDANLADAQTHMPDALPRLLRYREAAVADLTAVLAMARVCRPPAFRLYVPNLVARVEDMTELYTEFPVRGMGRLRAELRRFRRDALAERVNRYKPPPKEDP